MDTIKRTLSGIPNIFTIVFSGNTASGTALCNKTWQEVLDAYNNGAKVSHNGFHWINTYGDGNSWEPGVYGWDLVE